MRTFMTLIFAVGFVTACDGTDISDKDPIDSTPTADASVADGATTDGAAIDAAPIDAAQTTPAQQFCLRYDTICTFGDNPQFFATQQECENAYATFTPTQLTCVTSALDTAEGGGNKNGPCADATGSAMGNCPP